MDNKDLYQAIKRIVHKETIWLRHYIGIVKKTVDPENEGRVLVLIPELGIDSEENGFWCSSRDKNSISLPALDDWVEVYFISGDRDRPVYMGVANEMMGMLPKKFSGKKQDHILFENPNNDTEYIKYNEDDKQLSIVFSKIKLLSERVSDNLVAFNDLKSGFDTLRNNHNTHSHPAHGSPPSTPSTASIDGAKIGNIEVP